MLRRHSWLGLFRTLKIPTHPLTRKACDHRTLWRSAVLGMVCWTLRAWACLIFSASIFLFPVPCSLAVQPGPRPQAPPPDACQDQRGHQASATGE